MRPILLLAFLLAPWCAYAREATELSNPREKGAWVLDEVGLLSSEERAGLERLLAETERTTSAEVAVVLLHSVGKKVPKAFAVELFGLWGIGKKGRDNGLLFLLVMDQRRVEVETGYGLEGLLPDARVAQILRNEVVQNLKEGRPGPAVVNGVRAFVRTIERVEEVGTEEMIADGSAGESARDSLSSRLFVYSAPLLFLLALILRLLWLRAREKDYALLSARLRGAALFFGLPALLLATPITAMAESSLAAGGLVLVLGGLLLFALNRWARSFRYRPRACPACAKPMRRLEDPSEEYRYFNDAQAWEERLQSRDFDVWLCGCGERKIDEYAGRSSGKFQRCRRCGTRVEYLKGLQVLTAASYTAEGEELRTWHCQACGGTREERRAIARLAQASGSSSGGSGSSGGSSGSFGGGRSGGGGAGASW